MKRKKYNVYLILSDGSRSLLNNEPLPKYKAESLYENMYRRLDNMEYEGQTEFPTVTIEEADVE